MTLFPSPSPVNHRKAELRERVGDATGLLMGVDFDGTIAPIVADHTRSEITPRCRDGLKQLAAVPNVSIAVISGRQLSDLRTRVSLRGITYAGNHGLELKRGNEVFINPIADRHRPAIRRVHRELSRRLAEIPGCAIEDKDLTLSIHYRQAPPGRIAEVKATVQAAVDEEEDAVQIVPGKKVLEVRPAIDWDKGSTIDFLAATHPDDWVTVYIGDDTTDEDAFRAVGPAGIGIMVGTRKSTKASYVIPDRRDVGPFLEWILQVIAT